MTTGKIDRQAVLAQLKRTDSTNAPVAPVKAAEVSKVAEVKSSEPENLFGARSKALDPVTGPGGKAVSTSATANALWGQAALTSANPPLQAKMLKNLTPEQAQAKMVELKAKQAELGQRIDNRAKELDTEWAHTGNKKRCEILKGYMNGQNSLEPDTRGNLEAALQKTDACQASQDNLLAQAKTLPPSKGADAATQEARHEMAVKLWAARHATTDAVQTATQTIDQAGLKLERLASTEQAIDGGHSKYGQMSWLVGQYFETSFMMSTLNKLFFSPALALTEALDKESKDAAKRHVIEEHWRERDDLMRNMLKDLSMKEIDGKRDVSEKTQKAVRSGNVGAMNVTELNKLSGKR
jgi:hypothetical protein